MLNQPLPRATRRSLLGFLGGASLAGVAALSVPGGTALATPRPSGVPGAGGGSDRSGQVPPELLPGGEFDRLVAELAARDKFSGTVLLRYQGRTVLTRSYGMADRQRAIPNSLDTIFALASVTKLFTAVAVGQLVQQGALELHQTLGHYLDGFPAEIANGVTIHQLLTHTSGLGDFHQHPDYRASAPTWKSATERMDGTMAIIRRSPLEHAPGIRLSYSNSGYVVLGAVVAKVSARSYYDYVQENIFERAGMSRSSFYTRPQWLTDRRIAHPYATRPSSGRVDVIDQEDFIGSPAGNAMCSAPDMLRFAEALSDGKLLDPAYTGLFLSGKVPRIPSTPETGTPAPANARTDPAVSFQAYGPIASVSRTQRVVGHSGGGNKGKSTFIDIFSEPDAVLVVLSNYDGVIRPIFSLGRSLIRSGQPRSAS